MDKPNEWQGTCNDLSISLVDVTFRVSGNNWSPLCRCSGETIPGFGDSSTPHPCAPGCSAVLVIWYRKTGNFVTDGITNENTHCTRKNHGTCAEPTADQVFARSLGEVVGLQLGDGARPWGRAHIRAWWVSAAPSGPPLSVFCVLSRGVNKSIGQQPSSSSLINWQR